MAFSASVIFRGVDAITAPVKRMQASTQAFAASASVSFERVGFYSAGLSTKMEGLSSRMASFKSIMAGGIVFMGAKGLYDMAIASARASDEQIKFARRVDISLQSFKELNYAANKSGIATGELTKWFEKLERGMGHLKMNTGELYSFLAANDRALLGNLKKAKNNEQAFDLMVDAVSRVKNPMLRSTLAAAAFGEKASKMTNLLIGGTAGLKKMREEYRKFAGDNATAAMSSEDLIASQIKMNAAFNSVKNAIGFAAIPSLTKVMDSLAEWMAANKKMLKDNISSFIKNIAGAFLFVVKHLDVIIPLTMAYAGALVFLKVATVALKTVTLICTAINWAFAAVLFVMYAITGNMTMALINNKRAIMLNAFWVKASTVAQWLWNASLYGCPVVWIVAGILAIGAALYFTIKYWKDIVYWVENSNNIFARLISIGILPIVAAFEIIGFVINGAISIFKNLIAWFSKTEVFRILVVAVQSIGSVFKTVFDWVFDKISAVWHIIKQIASFVLKPFLGAINFTSDLSRAGMKDLTGNEKPVNKDASILTQKKILETNSSQNVQINIDDATGRARLGGNTAPIPVFINNTKGFEWYGSQNK